MPSHSPFIPKAFQVDVLNSFWSRFKYTCNLLILNPLSQLICCMPTSQDSPLLHLNFNAVSTFIASQGDFEYVSRLVNT